MKRPEVRGDMIIADVIDKHPELIDVMFNHGIQCFGCGAATSETLEQGYKGHYGEDADFASFLSEINGALEVEVCSICSSISSYDEPLFRMMRAGKEEWSCKKCM